MKKTSNYINRKILPLILAMAMIITAMPYITASKAYGAEHILMNNIVVLQV